MVTAAGSAQAASSAVGSGSGAASSAGPASRAAASAAATSTAGSVGSAEPTTPAATPPSTATNAITVTRVAVLCPFVVMVELAQRSTASLLSRTSTTQPCRCAAACKRTLDALLRCHRPSSRVLSTLTPRKRADGQPWLTAATCPGWAFPQFIAPPSTHVDGPPRPSSEPQKSVVVAW